MKKKYIFEHSIFVIFAFLICSMSACNRRSEDTSQVYATREKSCEAPSNPYTDGTGHYAGWKWAEEKSVSSCGGNSSSFIEGCEEYLSKEQEYQECQSENN